MGIPGLASALVKLNLLEPLHGREGLVGIPPLSVAALLARLQQQVSPKMQCRGPGRSLREGLSLGMDAERIAWAVAQVIGGSLPALDWKPPFDLASLVVDAERFHALADWPRSEERPANSQGEHPQTSSDIDGPPVAIAPVLEREPERVVDGTQIAGIATRIRDDATTTDGVVEAVVGVTMNP